MRLTSEQIAIIKQKTALIFGENAQVYLFDSRIDDNAKGGDIDFFIETSKETTLMDKLQLITLIQLAIGHRKIDLLVKFLSSKHQAIFDTVKNEDVLL